MLWSKDQSVLEGKPQWSHNPLWASTWQWVGRKRHLAEANHREAATYRARLRVRGGRYLFPHLSGKQRNLNKKTNTKQPPWYTIFEQLANTNMKYTMCKYWPLTSANARISVRRAHTDIKPIVLLWSERYTVKYWYIPMLVLHLP